MFGVTNTNFTQPTQVLVVVANNPYFVKYVLVKHVLTPAVYFLLKSRAHKYICFVVDKFLGTPQKKVAGLLFLIYKVIFGTPNSFWGEKHVK